MRRFVIVLPIVACVLLWHFGVIQLNLPPQPVRGVDVSHYQGEIDWPELARQDISFAYVKATEGSGATDDRFLYNWQNARNAGLWVGAYHFFSYDSPGAEQAANFIRNVPKLPDALPPVIDVEFYGPYHRSPADPGTAVPEIRAMADVLREHYGVSPMIYATRRSYRLYIEGNFDDCRLWMRDVFAVPHEDWDFWQYTDRARLKGYSGHEPFIDMNVFSGTRAEFEAY